MNVGVEDIRNIKPGKMEVFVCEDMRKVRSARSLIAFVKETGMPEGVADYESEKFVKDGIILLSIRAIRTEIEQVSNI